METMIVLSQKREQIAKVAKEIYDKIISVSKDRRPDEKQRTGIRVLVREQDTRNLVFVSVYEPSEASQFFAVEKAVRAGMGNDHSSQNSRDHSRLRYSGCVSIVIEGPVSIQASVSGLMEEEDVAVAIAVLSSITGLTTSQVIENIDMYIGELPDCFKQKDHYLCEILGI